jgi:hypothetical protein
MALGVLVLLPLVAILKPPPPLTSLPHEVAAD